MFTSKEENLEIEDNLIGSPCCLIKFSDKLHFGWLHISSLFCNQVSHVFDIVMSTRLGHAQLQEDT